MITLTLYFATNRNHVGQRWAPRYYGKNFSGDRSSNLRFGKVSVELAQEKVAKFLTKKVNKRVGDGEGLAEYITEQLREKHSIIAFKESKNEPLASITAFHELKSAMETNKDVVIFIHGFNVDWFEAVASAMALELMLNRHSVDISSLKDTQVFLFSWPSNGDMLKNKAYLSDRKDAEDSSLAIARGFLKLRDFLTLLAPEHTNPKYRECGQQLHLLCHSMGNYVLQHALHSLQEINDQKHLPRLFQHIFMCAPDVDDNVFESGQPMANVQKLARQVNVYYNNGDLAMSISDYTKGNPDRLGHNGAARPLQLHNKITQINCSDIVGGITEHSYYLWATVNEDIRQSIDDVANDANTRKRDLQSTQTWRLN